MALQRGKGPRNELVTPHLSTMKDIRLAKQVIKAGLLIIHSQPILPFFFTKKPKAGLKSILLMVIINLTQEILRKCSIKMLITGIER